MSDDILAQVRASAPRRWIGVGILASLGGLLLYVAVTTPPQTLGLQVFVVTLGGLALALAEKMRRATLTEISLTETELRDSDGTVIARVDQITRVNRGTFALKPSNGFTLQLKASQGRRRWMPGVWWRMGRRVGVGGVTAGSQTKVMAELLQAMIAARD
ncbi:hypothetical protein [Thalassovita taeanensis]|uniref:Uncharacterized protein n=1 Tax=Thalassovita taeanensis TaxID=657014 RepID=A0A1H9JU45_9RHOB|nr:hypothetical protein [Thalassovita taeanensis]SEQ90340.1 hypothetical protein SAMN04488092_11630 [Thalassovita taeanensis]